MRFADLPHAPAMRLAALATLALTLSACSMGNMFAPSAP